MKIHRHTGGVNGWGMRLGLLAMAGLLLTAVYVRGEEVAWATTKSNVWINGIRGGFLVGAQSLAGEVGGIDGVKILGSSKTHDMALASVSYGHMLWPVVGQGRWYRGNWELRGEVFGGVELTPSQHWFVGVTPHLRYNLATGTRWVPFLDAGAGLTATDIGLPDLGSSFEFNLQGGLGLHWFVRNNWAVTVEARYFHLSDAGTTHRNNGVNGVMTLIGVTYFF